MNETTQQFKKQLPRNMLLQVLSFAIHVGIGIWLAPYLIQHLGRAAYGLIPIAGMMTQYVSLISQNISASVQRFLTIALQRNDTEDANRIFSTAFFSYLVLGLIQIPVFGLIIYCAKAIFSIPEELFEDAVLLLLCSAASFLINLACSVFAVPIYANNRLDISRSIDIGRMISRLAGIVALFVAFGPALRYVGYIDLLVSIVSCGTQALIGRRLAPALKLAVNHFDWGKVRELVGMGWWLLISQVGSLLLFRTDVWVCNRFIGADSAGDYAALLQWSILVREAGSLVGVVIAPMIVIYYARSEIQNLVRISTMAVRVLSLGLAIPISVICVLSTPLLRIWLGDSYVRLAPLMVMTLCPLVIHVGVSPLFNINSALNRVKWPGVVAVVGGVVNVFMAILFAKYFKWGMYGVAIASIIVLTVRNTCFLPIYGAVILHRPWHTFIRSSVSGVLFLAVMMSSGYVVSQFIEPTTGLRLVVVGLTLATVGSGVAWFVLSKQDRRVLAGLLPPPFQSIALIGAQQ